jgi:tetratricopeptide (TPR) repeat protein
VAATAATAATAVDDAGAAPAERAVEAPATFTPLGPSALHERPSPPTSTPPEPDVPAPPEPDLPAPPAPAEAPVEAPAEGAASPGPAEAGQLKDFLLQTYLGIHSKNYYEVLGVEHAAGAEAVERAYREKLEAYSEERFGGVELGEDDDKLLEMGMIVQQAFTVLSDLDRRQQYDETLALARAQPEPEPDAFGAELYFQEGQVLLKQHDLEGAEEAFRRATTENPDQPDYHSYLGWTLFLSHGRGEAGARAARPHLEQAFQIAPDAIKAHELAGWIERDARNLDLAVEHLMRALKLGQPRLDLFEAVRDLLGQLGRHGDLEHQYRRLIFRLRDSEPEKTIGLWTDLAYLYMQKLGQPDNAKVALQVALKLSPGDPRVQAAMDAAGAAPAPQRSWQPVAEGHRQRLLAAPEDPEPLHDLVALHRQGNRPDHLLTAATILVHRGAATQEEHSLYRELAPRGLVRASKPISPLMLDGLRHPDDLPLVEQLMGLLSPVLSQVYPVSTGQFGGAEAQRIEGGAGETLDGLLAYVEGQLGISLPPLYWSDSLARDLAPHPAEELRLMVGTGLQGASSEALVVFVAARALSCVGQGRRHIYGRRGAELKTAILATLVLCRPSMKIPDPDGEIQRFKAGIEESDVPAERLSELMTQLLAQDKRINLSQWVRAVRCTSARIGLLACADLGAALDALGEDAYTGNDLVSFALSEAYSELRQQLGISVDV